MKNNVKIYVNTYIFKNPDKNLRTHSRHVGCDKY